MESIANNSGLSQFLLKLQTFVRKVPTNVGAWNEDGTVYQIKGPRFENEYLPAYFNCSRPSFIRQLHLYGFQKQANVGECWSFSHVKFCRDSLHLMNEIQRKKQKRKKNEVVSMSSDSDLVDILNSELRVMKQRMAALEKCVKDLSQRDSKSGIVVASETRQEFETVANAEDSYVSVPPDSCEEFVGEIATVKLVSAGNSIQTTISIFGKFLVHFIAECQKPSSSIQNIQLPMGHPFEGLLAHCASETIQLALIRALSYSDLVSLNETCEASLWIGVLPSRLDFFNAIIIQATSASGSIISQTTGGMFSHFLSLLMHASISKRVNDRPVDCRKSPLLSQILFLVHRDAMEPISYARNELEDYNTRTKKYHDTIGEKWICL